MCSLFSVDKEDFSSDFLDVLTLPSPGWQVDAMAGSAPVGMAWQQRHMAKG